MNVLITGANRGIGLEFVKHYSQNNCQVFACCRTPENATELKQIAEASEGKVKVYELEVINHQQIDSLAKELEGTVIDILINNAGVYGGRGSSLGQLDYQDWLHTLEVNTLSPIKISEAFRYHVARSNKKVIAQITSKMGSIADNTSGGSYLYRSSKAALNCANKSLAQDLSSQGVIAVVLHPGWVVTDMGGPNALINTQESVQGMCKIIEELKAEDSGKFFAYDGREIPW